MNTQPETFSNPIELKNMESLAFFGKVNASISHELKNIMAIISETAGLLTDLSEMAKRGNPIELDMLTESTQSIVEEIQRGFTTIRQMNRFSHSVDNPVASIDLREVLDLVSHLSGYLSFAGRMNIRPVDAPPQVVTCPFILQAVIYEAVVQLFKHAGPGTELDLSIRPCRDSAWQIRIKGRKGKIPADFSVEKIENMAASIGVTVQCDPHGDFLRIIVPDSAQAASSCPEPLME